MSLQSLIAVLHLSFAFVLADAEVCSSSTCEQSEHQSLLSIKSSIIKAHAASELDLNSLVQQHQQASIDLSRHLSHIAQDMDSDSSTKAFLETFKICGECSSFERWGEANDGGYLMCMDGLKKGSVSAAYSLGVEHHDQWSEDVLKNLAVPVNQFDCTVDTSDCKGCKFFKKCIVTADGKHPVPGHEAEGWSLTQALQETSQGQSADGSLLMKMDIESSEWPIYAQETPEALKKFGQLIVEFHNLQDETKHPEYLKAMQNIMASGFKVAHIHGNNYAGMYQTGSTNIPQVIEVTFVHGGARASGCSSDQIYEKLDAPNNAAAAELPLAHMD